jgi:hypothetical protein
MDFFVVPTIGFRILYGFVIVRLHRRDLVWINHNQPNSGMGCTPGHRGFSLGGGSALYDQGPRSDLRHCCHTPIARHGHSGQAYRTGFTLAEWLCRAVDRIDPAPISRPIHQTGIIRSHPILGGLTITTSGFKFSVHTALFVSTSGRQWKLPSPT